MSFAVFIFSRTDSTKSSYEGYTVISRMVMLDMH